MDNRCALCTINPLNYEDKMTLKERIKGRKIGIVGMARSGMAAARLVRRMGGIPFISDMKSAENLMVEIAELKSSNIDHEYDGHTEKLLESDYIILSPGVPKNSEIVRKLEDAGIPIFSEIELASWFCKGRIIAITGSNGKTTTTTLIGEILKKAGVEHIVCGNIGHPFSDAADKISENGYAVVEVSNFQLERIEEFRPYVSLILNLTPDHLDRYENFDGYVQAKYRIAENQTESEYLILNADDSVIDLSRIATKANVLYFTIKKETSAGVFQRGKTLAGVIGGNQFDITDVEQIRIPGPHNLQNAAASALAAMIVGVRPNDIAVTLKEFSGVEHRLEDVATISGVRFVNDSKATNVDAVCYALQSFEEPIYLIAGGRDKDSDFLPIKSAGKGKIKEIILIGEARDKMFEELGKEFPVQFAGTMQEAVQKAYKIASEGDLILLSPACASFDMFDNFEHRGQVFKHAVAALNNNNHPAKV